MSEHIICTKAAEIAVMGSDIKSMKADIHEIKHAILGNGQPGLKTELAKQGQIVGALVWFTGSCVVGIIGVIGTLVVQFIRGH